VVIDDRVTVLPADALALFTPVGLDAPNTG